MRFTTFVAAGLALAGAAAAKPCPKPDLKPIKQIELGPRPYYLINDLEDGPLKDKLSSCSDMEMKPNTWSIGHRGGGTLQFPEHSKESNLAGARMGAGIIECDVSATKDFELVCRHSQCDLHTTTNIVAIPELNKKCNKPFSPAKDGKDASAQCCTSDITLDEFKSLCAKMDGFNASATTPEDFLNGTPDWRTDLYATCGTVLSHKEHIKMTEELGLTHSPELKYPVVPFPENYTQEMYAQQMIDNYKEAGVPASRVYPQSFNYPDILYWIKHDTPYGKQAMYLDSTGDTAETFPGAVKNLTRYARDGVTYVSPPLNYLVTEKNGKIVPSSYAKKANKVGLGIISWSLERSPPMARVHEDGDYYYNSIQDVVTKDSDIYHLVDVLYQQVGISGLFSDWSATVSYYANCFDIKSEL